MDCGILLLALEKDREEMKPLRKNKELLKYGVYMKHRHTEYYIHKVEGSNENGKLILTHLHLTTDLREARKIKDETVLKELARLEFDEVEVMGTIPNRTE